MLKGHLIVSSVLFTILFSISAFAQAAAPVKIAFLNSDAFYDDKLGILKLVRANKQLDTEFAPQVKVLQDGNTRLQTIANDLDNLQKLPPAQFNQTAFNTKQEEGERLQRELTYKKTELEEAVKKRRIDLIAPISEDIGKAITEFATKGGYGVILDIGKLNDSGAVLHFTPAADLTKDFITFYNARTATAAAPPK